MASEKKGKKDDREKLIRKALDDAMPIGIRAHTHMDPAAQESGFSRQASSDISMPPSSLAGSSGGSNIVSRGPLLYVDPMFDPILFLFPKDRIDEINKRLRHYYETDPIVGSAIDMHTNFPLSDFHLQCEDPRNQQYWNDFKDRTGLLEFLRNLLHDHWLLGEGIGYPVWDEYNMEVSHFNQYPPENIDIVQSYVTPRRYFLLKPDPKLSEKLKSSSKLDQTVMNMMDPAYVKALEENKPFVLGSDEKVMYLARLNTKYRTRGISILARALKDLLYKDKLRLLQLTFVDRHMFPIKIFKLGSEQRGWIPNKKHFERLGMLLKQAQNDPDFNILYHFGLTVDYVGTKDRIANLIPEFEWVERQIMAALFVNEEILHGGLPSAVRDTVNMRTLMYRYLDAREKIERMMITHIFLPIARARGMYRSGMHKKAEEQERVIKKIAGEERQVPVEFLDDSRKMFRVANSHSGSLDISAYDIPRPIWKKMNLVNNIAEQQLLVNLEDAGKVPLSMVLDMLGLDPEMVAKKLTEQESTPLDGVWREIRESLARDKNIRRQVLKGVKHGKWSLPEGVEPEMPAGMDAMKGRKAPGIPGMPLPPGGAGKAPKAPAMAPGQAPGAIPPAKPVFPPKAAPAGGGISPIAPAGPMAPAGAAPPAPGA